MKTIRYIQFNDRKQLIQNRRNFKNFNCKVNAEYYIFFGNVAKVYFNEFNIITKYYKSPISVLSIECPYIEYDKEYDEYLTSNNMYNFFKDDDITSEFNDEVDTQLLKIGTAQHLTNIYYSLITGKIYIWDYNHELFKGSSNEYHLIFDSLSQFQKVINIEGFNYNITLDKINRFVEFNDDTIENYTELVNSNISYENIKFNDDDFKYDIFPIDELNSTQNENVLENKYSTIKLRDNLIKAEIDENKVKLIENRFGIVLPKQYRNFLLNYNIDFHEFFQIGIVHENIKSNECMLFNSFLKIEGDESSLIDCNLDYDIPLSENFLIISSEAESYYLIDLENGEIGYLDSSCQFEYSINNNVSYYKIADNFNIFLDNIYFLDDDYIQNFKKNYFKTSI